MPTFTLVGTATGATGTGSLTPTMPTYAAGDLSLFLAFARTTSETITTPPSGYVLLEPAVSGTGSGEYIAVYGKNCSASESAPTVGFSGAGRHVAVMGVLRSSTGWPTISVASDIVVNTTEAAGTETVSIANGITPAENDCCVVAVCGKSTTTNDITDVATPSSYADLAEYIFNGAAGAILSSWFLGQTTAATLSDENAALTGGVNNTATGRVTLALRGAEVGGPAAPTMGRCEYILP